MKRTTDNARSGMGIVAATITALTLLPACGDDQAASRPTSDTSVTLPHGTSSPASADDSRNVVPWAELDHYLGLDVTAADLAPLTEASELAIQACMREQGFEFTPAAVEPGDIDEQLRRTDPSKYGATYGYGFFTFRVSRVDAVPDDNIAVEATLPPDTWIAAEQACREQHPSEVAAVMPTAAVSNRAFDLREAAEASDKGIVAARAAWAECMSSAGYAAKNDQDVQSLLITRLADVPVAYPDSERADNPWVIPPALLAEFVAFEVGVWEADTGCRQASDLAAAERAAEVAIIAQLRNEFGFDGVDLTDG